MNVTDLLYVPWYAPMLFRLKRSIHVRHHACPQETVLYALSSCDARKVLEQSGTKNLEDALPDDEVLYKK